MFCLRKWAYRGPSTPSFTSDNALPLYVLHGGSHGTKTHEHSDEYGSRNA